MWEQVARLVLLITSHVVFPLCPAEPCTVNSAIMTAHNIAFSHSWKDTLYAPHNDHITFSCTRGNPVDSSGMRRKCVDGEMPLPSCNWIISLNGHAVVRRMRTAVYSDPVVGLYLVVNKMSPFTMCVFLVDRRLYIHCATELYSTGARLLLSPTSIHTFALRFTKLCFQF